MSLCLKYPTEKLRLGTNSLTCFLGARQLTSSAIGSD